MRHMLCRWVNVQVARLVERAWALESDRLWVELYPWDGYLASQSLSFLNCIMTEMLDYPNLREYFPLLS